MTPFASVFQRMLWLVLVSFLSDYKTLPAFHPSEHKQVNEDEKKAHQISSLCPEFVPPTVFTAMRKRPTLDFLSKTWYSLCLYAMCPWVCTARDFAPAIRPYHLSLSVYCTWFCPCYTSLSLVPECVLHVILPLLYVPFHLPQGVYCAWFCLCYTSLLPCPCVCTARDFAPAIRSCCLSLCVYRTRFCC